MKIGLYVIKQVINQIKMDSLCLLFNQAGGVRTRGEEVVVVGGDVTGGIKTERGGRTIGQCLFVQ